MTSIRRRTIILFAALATLAALLSAGPAQAKPGEKREMTVMSRNLYLGASLAPALDPTFPGGIVGAIPVIINEFFSTDYIARAGALAEEIAAEEPDLIGLQEVAVWTFEGGPTVDFLYILKSQLAARGLTYIDAATSYNANIVVPGAVVTFQDRDVILVNKATSGLVITGSSSGNYDDDAQFVLRDTPIGDISFNRGWALVDGTFEGKKFRFVNTHLETEDFPTFQEAQAAEFLAGPAKKGGAVIAVGDFNSAADGSNTASYGMLTKAKFRDAWDLNAADDGFTCCFDSGLAIEGSELTSRIDLVLTHGAARAISAVVVGNTEFQGSAPLWPSDHAGVVAVIRIH